MKKTHMYWCWNCTSLPFMGWLPPVPIMWKDCSFWLLVTLRRPGPPESSKWGRTHLFHSHISMYLWGGGGGWDTTEGSHYHQKDLADMAMGQNPVNIPIPTKIGSNMGGEFTNPIQSGIPFLPVFTTTAISVEPLRHLLGNDTSARRLFSRSSTFSKSVS